MKTISAILVNIIIAFILQLFLPWWIVIIVSAIVAYAFGLKGGAGFVMGFLSIFILWFGYSYFRSSYNDHMLAERIGELFMNVGIPMIFVLSGIIGGIFGGLGSLIGYSFRKAFGKN